MVSGSQGERVQGSAVSELGCDAALEFVDALCYSAADDGGGGWGGEEGADLRMAWEVELPYYLYRRDPVRPAERCPEKFKIY